MTFNRFNRRLHLYLALLLVPWILMYGVSSFVINHNPYFQGLYDDGVPQWTDRFDRPYHRVVPEDADLEQIAADILEDVGLEGDFFVRRPTPARIDINLGDFWSNTRVVYAVDEGRIRAQDRRFQWNHLFVKMHERSGYHRESVLQDTWAVIVDVACLGLLIFMASGVYMWWQLKATRLWGSVAIGAGVVTFVIFLVKL